MGMTIRKCIVVPTLFGYFLGFHPYMFLKCFFVTCFCCFFCGEEKGMNGV